MKRLVLKNDNKKKGSRCKPIRKSRNYKKKIQGNRFTNASQQNQNPISSSAKKISKAKAFSVECNETLQYVFFTFLTLRFSTLSKFVKCKDCNGDITFSKEPISGLGFKLLLTCPCSLRAIDSCKRIGTSFEVNRKLVFLMRLLGIRHVGLTLFCSLMDITSSFSTNLYYGALDNIHSATKAVLDRVLLKAGKEEKAQNKARNFPEDELSVSGDGTWARRGFSSLVGVSSIIGKFTGKVLDIFISSKRCQGCETAKKSMNPTDFLIWSETEHAEKCDVNYEGSSGGMEVQGILEMFKRSITLHKAKYAYYIGDGDSKTFTNLLSENPYVDFIVKKLECVLHVGKRMFRRLKEVEKLLTQKRKLEKERLNKEKDQNAEPEKEKRKRRSKNEPKKVVVKTVDLTAKIMKEMSLFYGTSIQKNPDSTEKMKNDVWAYFYHRSSTDNNPQHEYCDKSWCKYLQDQDINKTHKHKPALSEEVQEVVKPIYESLTEEDLLNRCLGGNTQNNNESLNALIWTIAPKHFFHGKKTIEIASWTTRPSICCHSRW